MEFDSGFFQSDITAYETQAGLPNVPVQPVLLDGYGGGLGIAPDEVSLDIEMAISMAPGLSAVYVFEGATTDDILNAMACEQSGQTIERLLGLSIDAASEQIFQQFAAQGQSFFNCSGDWPAWVGLDLHRRATIPISPIVGGTTLTTDPHGAWASETVWNWDC